MCSIVYVAEDVRRCCSCKAPAAEGPVACGKWDCRRKYAVWGVVLGMSSMAFQIAQEIRVSSECRTRAERIGGGVMEAGQPFYRRCVAPVPLQVEWTNVRRTRGP
jgi:hypothetical protein